MAVEYKVEDISPVKKKVHITSSPEEVDAAIKAGVELYRKDAKLDGFRQGKVPAQVIEKRFHDSIYKNAQEDLVNVHINEVLQKESLQPLSRLVMAGGEAGLRKGQPFEYSMEFEVAPAIDLPNYEGLEVTQEKPKPDDAAIDSMLKRMQNERAKIVPVEGTAPAKDGQIANIDFEAWENGKRLDNFSTTNFNLEIGNKQALEEFENLVKSIPVGHTGEGDVHFPDDFIARDIAGKTLKMKITVHSVSERQLPELDDNFAIGLQKKDMADLRDSLAKAYDDTMARLHKSEAQKKLLDSLVKQTDFELPPSMVQMETAFLVSDWAERMERQGKHVPESELTEEKLVANFKPRGEERAREKLLLMAIAKKENLEVDPKEVNMEVLRGAMKMGEKFQDYYDKMRESGMIFQLRDNMLCDKAMDLVYERAKVTMVESENTAKNEAARTEEASAENDAAAKNEAAPEEGGKNAD